MLRLRMLGYLSLALTTFLAAGCSNEVKIGVVISESGALHSYGEKAKKGLDLALEEVNAAGGYKGHEIVLIYKDDATNPSRGTQVTEELIRQDGVRAIIGAMSSSVTLAIAPICEKERVILLSPASSNPAISEAGDYIYRNWPSDILEGTAMAKFARDLGLERVAIFAIDKDYGEGLRDVFTQQYAGKFREIIKTFDFQEGNPDALKGMVQELVDLKPDGVYIASYEADIAVILRDLHDARIKAVRMASASVTPDLIKLAGPAAERLVYPQPVFDLDSQQPEVASFVRAYRDKYHEDPDKYAAHAYDALKLLVAAMELGGSPHPDDIKLGLRGMKDYEGAAGLTVFDANGDVVRYPRIYIIDNGKSISYESFVESGRSLLTSD